MKLCKRCAGAGFLFRPQPTKLITFRRCTSCISGVRILQVRQAPNAKLKALLARKPVWE